MIRKLLRFEIYLEEITLYRKVIVHYWTSEPCHLSHHQHLVRDAAAANLQFPTPDTNIGIEMVSQGGVQPLGVVYFKKSLSFIMHLQWVLSRDGELVNKYSQKPNY